MGTKTSMNRTTRAMNLFAIGSGLPFLSTMSEAAVVSVKKAFTLSRSRIKTSEIAKTFPAYLIFLVFGAQTSFVDAIGADYLRFSSRLRAIKELTAVCAEKIPRLIRRGSGPHQHHALSAPLRCDGKIVDTGYVLGKRDRSNAAR